MPKVEILPRSRSIVHNDIAPPETHVKDITNYLLQAKRPVLFLGNECTRYDVSEEVAEIAEILGALVMLANKIPIVFPTTHPNFAGQFHADDPDLSPDIDCFWSLGAHMFKRAKKPEVPLINRNARVMHTSLAEQDIARNYPVDSAAIASIQTTTRAVLAELKKHDLNTPLINARKEFVEAYNSQRRATLESAQKDQWNDSPIAASRLIGELDKAIGEQAYIVSEIVTSDRYLRRYLRFDHKQPSHERRRNFDTTSGVLGWAMAAAIGVKIGSPDKETWCLTGDGCFNFGCQALWSAARYEVPIGFVVFNNGQYQANRLNQNKSGGRRMKATGKYIGVNLGHPDINYVAQAATYGIKGERVEEPDKLEAALIRCRDSMKNGQPYVLDVKIAKEHAGKESDWFDHFSVAQMQNS